jgi:SAM-dependent methyltransferase
MKKKLDDCFNPEGPDSTLSHEEHLERYRFASKFAAGRRCLDIACGAGYGSRMLFDSGAKYVLGADISEKNIQFAKEKYLDNKTIGKLDYRIQNLEIENNTNEYLFDLVVSFETIEHINADILGLKNLFNSLCNGGFLIISSPNRAITNPYLKSNTPCNGGGHIREYTIPEFRKLFISTGFVEVGLYGQRQQKLFSARLLEKHYKRLFKPSKKSSPVVSQVTTLNPEYFIFLLVKP